MIAEWLGKRREHWYWADQLARFGVPGVSGSQRASREIAGG
jgi:hypothetical protein